jgi:hypothetical protein
MRPHHKYVAFDAKYSRFLDCEVHRKEIVAVLLNPTFTICAYGLKGWRTGARARMTDFGGAACRLVNTTCMQHQVQSVTELVYAVDRHLMDYDYAEMRRQATPLREELLAYVMHPCRFARVVPFG